ncbi:DUF6502 family protein [Ramlibacter albus]|uniref:Uncharacterized protein n=1 Tax=Ramlibacter albus TaxID=2079448 RepID=A0A923MCR7_9BURK|nr:DUF6502 family protein [Ramlibacter albus]MBC5768300.1 hypothetical protein [Ramlibacter albus]
MPSRPAIVLAAVLRAFKPLARLLLRHGVAYPAFAAALKQVFLEAAVEELQRAGKKQTDSAISLLSGVHRRDVRNLGRLDSERIAVEAPMNMASQVMSRWLTDPTYLDDDGQPLALDRAGFDALVTAISSDVRPRAVLDELTRLAMAEEGDDGVRLLAPGFVPRQGFPEMAALLGDNIHDHAAAAGANIEGEGNYLEQAIFAGELSADSVKQLHTVSAKAWRQAFKTVMREAQARFDHDRQNASPAERIHRARFGAYFYACDDHERPS